jgi:hypothetical protein
MVRILLQLASFVLVVTALVLLPGCGSQSAASKTAPAESGHFEGDGHDHTKDVGDHSGHDHEKEGEHK